VDKRLVPAVTRAHNYKRRFASWLNPPEKCDCCEGPAVLVQNRVLYGRNHGDWPVLWFCLSCEASVGCHPQSVYPLGRMADRATKNARTQVHQLLDPLWQEGPLSRDEAYALLAERMNVPPWEEVHVGEMTLEECARAADCLRELSLAVQFGV
jgi:hypothetical protein